MGGLSPNFVRFEPPDICYSRLVGEFSRDEVVRLNAEVKAITSSQPHVFVLVDASLMISMRGAARKASMEHSKDIPVLGCAVFGANYHVQVVGTLLAKAMQLVHKKANRPMRFFDTEADARAWIAEQRSALARIR